jgi:hypothetical protein
MVHQFRFPRMCFLIVFNNRVKYLNLLNRTAELILDTEPTNAVVSLTKQT